MKTIDSNIKEEVSAFREFIRISQQIGVLSCDDLFDLMSAYGFDFDKIIEEILEWCFYDMSKRELSQKFLIPAAEKYWQSI